MSTESEFPKKETEPPSPTPSRRDFLKGATAFVAAGPLGFQGTAMPDRPFGRTGHRTRLFSLGGQSALERPRDHDLALQIINRALDLGVNYVDTAPRYGNGASQRVLGEVMSTRRRDVFLASKTHERGSRDASLRLLEGSLKALQTDYLDLWQIHNVREDEHLEAIFRKGGALDALTWARDQKMVRFLGITGHYDPLVLLRAIERFDFDALLIPVNAADRHPLYFLDRWVPHPNRNRLSFLERLVPTAQRKQMAIVGMKVPARGRIFRPGGVRTMGEALGYALSCPVSTVILGCDSVAQLEENVRLATAFRTLPAAEMARLEAVTESYAHEAAYFKRGGAGGDTQ